MLCGRREDGFLHDDAMTPPRPFSCFQVSKTEVEACECLVVGIVAFRESEENAIALVGRESLFLSLAISLECSAGRGTVM